MGRREMFAALVEALDAMPAKELAAQMYDSAHCCRCALAVLAEPRDLFTTTLEARILVTDRFCLPRGVAAVIDEENDRLGDAEPRPARWTRMRAWAQQQLEACS